MTEQDPKRTREGSLSAEPWPSAPDMNGARAPADAEGWSANMRRRVLSGVPALLAVLAVVALAPTFVIALIVAAVGVMGMMEYHQLLPDPLRRQVRLQPALISAGLVGLGAVFLGLAGLNLMLLAGVLVITWHIWFREQAPIEEGLTQAGIAVLGLVLIPWLLNHFALIHRLPGGGGWLAMLVIVVSLNDTLAYLVGSLLGTRPLIPSVSPNKTVEGAAAGLAGGVAGGLIGWLWLLSFPSGPGFFEALILGGALAAVAQAGDLLESKLKRLVGADESGSFLPGHGGILDRLDAYILTTPLFYYYLVLTAPTA